MTPRSSSKYFLRPLVVIGIAGGWLAGASLAETGSAGGKSASLDGQSPAVQGSGASIRDQKITKPGNPVTGGRVRQISPIDPGSDAGKPSVPDGRIFRGKVAGDGAPDSKGTDLPASPAGTKDVEKPGVVDPGLFDPNLTGPGSPAPGGKSKAAPRFPIWQDPGLAERNRAMGMDLLTSPLIDPRLEQAPTPSNEETPPPPPFVVPGLYGRAPNVLFPGRGRAVKPWSSHAGLSLQNGYDSNGFEVPNNAQSAAARKQGGSFTTGAGLYLDVQYLTAHSVFTLDANATGTYYWNRDKDKTLFNIPTWVLQYSSELDDHTRMAVNFNLNYLSEADYANVHASQNGGGQDYVTATTKIDLIHKWARHFSTDTALEVNLLYYPDGSQNASRNQLDIFVGNEFRFETSKQLTWVLEGRYGRQEDLSDAVFNSDTLYFLAGLEWLWLEHVTTSLRAGATVRTSQFGTSTSPLVELSGDFKTGRHSSLRVNTRYGVQLTGVTGEAPASFSAGLSYQQVLARRLSGNAGIDYFHEAGSQIGNSSSTGDGVSLSVGLQYQVTPRFSWDTQYSFSQSSSASGQQNYNRSVAIISARFAF